jgi:PAS domain S-box-containing protein
MNNRTVFAVDDEVTILELYQSILGTKQPDRLDFFESLDDEPKKQPFDLHTFESGEAYLLALKARYEKGERVAVSIIDMRLPGKHGLEVAKEARQVDPEMTIIIVTAFSDYSVEELLGQFEQNIYYIRKPFRHDELYLLVVSSLQHWNDRNKAVDTKFELAVDAIEDGLWDWNPKTNEVYFSKRWKEMLGYSDDEISNHLQEWSDRVHPDDMEQVRQDIDDHLKGKSDYYVNEHRLRCKDGSYKWILDRGKALFDEAGEPYRVTGFHTDITERKKLESELKTMLLTPEEESFTDLSDNMKLQHTNSELELRLKKEIRKRQESEKLLLQHTRQAAMGEMMSMIAHQWRQPITAIGLSTDNIALDVALGSLNESELQENLKMIRQQVDYLSQTIDDFRDFFLPNKTREQVLVSDALKAALRIIGKSLENRGIQIVKQFEDRSSIPSYKNELVQVFLNLLKNAQDILGERNVKQPRIVLETIEQETSIEVRVTDNGGGIPAEHIMRVFEPYFTTKDQYNGTGLGLYMSKTIIEDHCRGTLRVENIDDGARFTLILPKTIDRDEKNSPVGTSDSL